ncbi:histidine kinase dimerization/phospho-acceptor domain-containing protein [Paenibacillus sp. NPDC058071]|uniref:HAMP domain-containing sensor histidine kinase n=1 Tax=Paenibacillus sp. NPDC058071 TaxID=3346326 RepID=UPI0036D80FFA
MTDKDKANKQKHSDGLPTESPRNDSIKQKRSRGFFKNRSSLQTRYILLMLSAFLFLPLVLSGSGIVYSLTATLFNGAKEPLKYGGKTELEKAWHREAGELWDSSGEEVDNRLRQLKEAYPEASLFWVDDTGKLRLQLEGQERREEPLPDDWSPADAIRFMKSGVKGDPFTVVAFIGGSQTIESSFMVLQMPRELLQRSQPAGWETPFYGIFTIVIFVLFIVLSLLFIRQLRKRLLRLQKAMGQSGASGIPNPVELTRDDEIGQLEISFNRMVEQLEDSVAREKEEEELRKRLIANLSHDLRTPLTVMGSHLYTLRGEELSAEGREAAKQLTAKISDMSELIENLLSYTLMTSGKYPLKLEKIDAARLAKECAAAWYPLWEKEGIDAEVDLPAGRLMWEIDREGFKRLLDNLFQNVVRHAAAGCYIGLTVEPTADGDMLVISDRGPGLAAASERRGSGIGLAIVDYLAREMGLDWRTISNEDGTRVYLRQAGAKVQR